jgi:hypothetical protein
MTEPLGGGSWHESCGREEEIIDGIFLYFYACNGKLWRYTDASPLEVDDAHQEASPRGMSMTDAAVCKERERGKRKSDCELSGARQHWKKTCNTA